MCLRGKCNRHSELTLTSNLYPITLQEFALGTSLVHIILRTFAHRITGSCESNKFRTSASNFCSIRVSHKIDGNTNKQCSQLGSKGERIDTLITCLSFIQQWCSHPFIHLSSHVFSNSSIHQQDIRTICCLSLIVRG